MRKTAMDYARELGLIHGGMSDDVRARMESKVKRLIGVIEGPLVGRIKRLEAAIEAQRRKLSSITDQIAALYLIADAAAAALDDARAALDDAIENDD